MHTQGKMTQARSDSSRRARRLTRRPEQVLGALLWGGLFAVLLTLGS